MTDNFAPFSDFGPGWLLGSLCVPWLDRLDPTRTTAADTARSKLLLGHQREWFLSHTNNHHPAVALLVTNLGRANKGGHRPGRKQTTSCCMCVIFSVRLHRKYRCSIRREDDDDKVTQGSTDIHTDSDDDDGSADRFAENDTSRFGSRPAVTWRPWYTVEKRENFKQICCKQ